MTSWKFDEFNSQEVDKILASNFLIKIEWVTSLWFATFQILKAEWRVIYLQFILCDSKYNNVTKDHDFLVNSFTTANIFC